MPFRPPGYLVIANAAAGSTARSVVNDVAGRLAESAPTEITWTEDGSDFDGAVDRLEGRRLVLVGGDGTFHLALNRLSALGRLDEPVGLIPAGTGNDFARGTGLGSDVARAVEVVLADRARRQPVLDVGGLELAHNNVHVGLGLVAAERGAAWKPRLGRLAYPVATVVEGLTYEGLEVTVRSGADLLFEGPALAVLVLLGPSMGGGIEPVGGIDVGVARLDVIVVEPVRPVARAGLAFAALRQGLDHARDVRRWTLDDVVLSTAATLRGDVDGEVREWDGEVTIRVESNGWVILSPPGGGIPAAT